MCSRFPVKHAVSASAAAAAALTWKFTNHVTILSADGRPNVMILRAFL